MYSILPTPNNTIIALATLIMSLKMERDIRDIEKLFTTKGR